MMEPYKVLGLVNPLVGIDPRAVKIDAIKATIESTLSTFLKLGGYRVLNVNIKSPDKDKSFSYAASKLHKDNPRDGDLFAIWCSDNPTMIVVDKTKEVFVPQPMHVVLVDNTQCSHKKPDNIRGRWFVRIAVEDTRATVARP